MKWSKKGTGHWERNLDDMLVLKAIQRSPTEWMVTSSHAQPTGLYGTLEAAQGYADRFARSLLERALSELSAVEAVEGSGAGRWRRSNGRFIAVCGVVIVRTSSSLEDWLIPDASGAVDLSGQPILVERPDFLVFIEQDKVRALSAARVTIQRALAEVSG